MSGRQVVQFTPLIQLLIYIPINICLPCTQCSSPRESSRTRVSRHPRATSKDDAKGESHVSFYRPARFARQTFSRKTNGSRSNRAGIAYDGLARWHCLHRADFAHANVHRHLLHLLGWSLFAANEQIDRAIIGDEDCAPMCYVPAPPSSSRFLYVPYR